MYYQHGDVLIKRINAIPTGAIKKSTNILAEGEVTGHAHRVTGGDVYEKDGVLYLHLETETEVTHEEHHTQVIPAGDYQIGIVREYDHVREEEHNVAD